MKKAKEIDYGILGDISKEANCTLFGDCSGSTISRRTTKGFKRSFGLNDENISDQNAEHIVHGIMIISFITFTYSIVRKSGKALIWSLLLLLVIIFWYQTEK